MSMYGQSGFFRERSMIGLNSGVLKLIAITSMFIDHVGKAIYPEIRELRCIGRLAFPIFAFLLVEGYFHTRDVKKYLLRLIVLGIISELPFDYVLYGTWIYPEHQNVMFTLALGLILIYLSERTYEKAYKLAFFVLFMIIATLLCTDYMAQGIMMIYTFYIFRNEKMAQLIVITIINTLLMQRIQAYGAFAMFPILLYNGKQGFSSMKYAFYAFYPLHLIAIGFLKLVLV